MQQAVKLLATNRTLKEVAGELAYLDAAHFTNDFKAYYGISPGQRSPQRVAGELFAGKCRVFARNVAFLQVIVLHLWDFIVL